MQDVRSACNGHSVYCHYCAVVNTYCIERRSVAALGLERGSFGWSIVVCRSGTVQPCVAPPLDACDILWLSLLPAR